MGNTVTRGGMEAAEDAVRIWHEKVGLPVEGSPVARFDPNEHGPGLAKVIEEVGELDSAAREGESLAALGKELADVLFSAISFGALLGLPVGELFAAVVQSNFSKAGPRDPETGFIPKGDSYRAPDIEAVLARAGGGA
ncbi:MAG: nucleoside triphosphate pyrophosphohydrolase family protein [Planctomycetota bacterium]